MSLVFESKKVTAGFRDSSGNEVNREIEIRRNPVTLRTSRITYARSLEKERGAKSAVPLEKADLDTSKCPFCPDNIKKMTPTLSPRLQSGERLVFNNSVLFPNLFPYTKWSAVSLFDNVHYMEIGRPETASYRDCFINCARYLFNVLNTDSTAVFMSITQNYLPAAGGSLVHPHLQVHADSMASNFHFHIKKRADGYKKRHGTSIYADYIKKEKETAARYIGSTGKWEWTASFAPEGFFEIWGVCPGQYSLVDFQKETVWDDLARGVINTQKLYRHLGRNSYNLGLVSVASGERSLELKVSLAARSNYAPWTRSDITGFEFTQNEMATFTAPESTALMARNYWHM